MRVREYCSTTADYYDSGNSGYREDIEFWTSVADSVEGPVLEIGCGTGRVSLEIARRGKTVVAVDQSEAILDVFRRKLAAEPVAVQRRVRLHSDDMRRFRLTQKFALVLMPFRPMQHMLTLEDQLAALATARAHLEVGGLFGFDVFFPNFRSFEQPHGEEKLEVEWTHRNGPTIRRYYVRHSVDKLNQVIYGSYIFRTYDGTDLLSEETSPLNMSYFTYPQLLLKLSQLELAEQYGSFARAPITAQQEMIILARAV